MRLLLFINLISVVSSTSALAASAHARCILSLYLILELCLIISALFKIVLSTMISSEHNEYNISSMDFLYASFVSSISLISISLPIIFIADFSEDGDGFGIGADTNSAESQVWDLGYYKTEERAKEVFKEIIDTYKFNRTEAVEQKQAVYYMPEE